MFPFKTFKRKVHEVNGGKSGKNKKRGKHFPGNSKIHVLLSIQCLNLNNEK